MAKPQVALQVFGFGFAILGGQILLPLLIGTIMFARNVHRNPLLVILLIPWVIYSIGVCLLLYTGNIDEDVPPRGVCYAQLAMTLGAVVMASAALVSFSVSLYYSAPRDEEHGELPLRSICLLASIPVLGIAGYEMSLLHIIQMEWYELNIERDVLVCAIKGNHEIIRVAESVAAGAALVSFVLTIDLVCKFWGGLKQIVLRRPGYKDLVKYSWKVVFIRLVAFEVYCVLAMGACMILLSDPSRSLREAMWSFADSVPLASAIIFGSTPDVLDVWRFWKRKDIKAEYVEIA